jgi:hypothetical protein
MRRNSPRTSAPDIPGRVRSRTTHVDLRCVGPKPVYRRLAISRLDHRMAFSSEHLGNSRANRFFVLNYQDGSGKASDPSGYTYSGMAGIARWLTAWRQ